MAHPHRGIAGHGRSASSTARSSAGRSATAKGWRRSAATSLSVDGEEQDRRLEAAPEAFRDLLHQHACEGMYAAPEYGGNRDLVAWQAIGFLGDVEPRGYTDAEVSEP